jgi:hypothetical protein
MGLVNATDNNEFPKQEGRTEFNTMLQVMNNSFRVFFALLLLFIIDFLKLCVDQSVAQLLDTM